MRQALGDAAFWEHDPQSIRVARAMLESHGWVLHVDSGSDTDSEPYTAPDPRHHHAYSHRPNGVPQFSWSPEAQRYID